MILTPETIELKLLEMGFHIKSAGDSIEITPENVPPSIVRLIRANKAALLEYLRIRDYVHPDEVVELARWVANHLGARDPDRRGLAQAIERHLRNPADELAVLSLELAVVSVYRRRIAGEQEQRPAPPPPPKPTEGPAAPAFKPTTPIQSSLPTQGALNP